MSKQEKYYNYIVNDLMKDVVVDAPYDVMVHGILLDYRGFGKSGLTIDHRFVNDLKDFLIIRYGLRESEINNELNIVWFRFKKRVWVEILNQGDY